LEFLENDVSFLGLVQFEKFCRKALHTAIITQAEAVSKQAGNGFQPRQCIE